MSPYWKILLLSHINTYKYYCFISVKLILFLSLQSYLSLHSYGQKILYPWSYSAVRLHDWQEMQDVGRKIANTIEKNYSSDR